MFPTYFNLTSLNLLKKAACKSLHMSSSTLSSQSPLFRLRQKTGLAYNLCREALNKHDNNVNEAEAWLQAQALSLGLQKATKVGGRSAKEGLIGLATDSCNKSVSLLELNCETDFVAKNQLFKDLTLDLTEQVALMKSGFSLNQSPDQEIIEETLPASEYVKELNNQIAPLISRLGENIKIQKALRFKVTNENTRIFGQIHGQTSQRSTGDLELITGRFAALVALKNRGNHSTPDNWNAIGNRLCKHVIGFSPTYIELPDNIRQHLEQAEREKADSIVENSDGEEHSDAEEANLKESSRDDWPSIMDQMLIMSENQTVREFCKENEMSIVYFKRFECACYY